MDLNSNQSSPGDSKLELIHTASAKGDVKQLAELALAPRGLVDDESRRKACTVAPDLHHTQFLLTRNVPQGQSY